MTGVLRGKRWFSLNGQSFEKDESICKLSALLKVARTIGKKEKLELPKIHYSLKVLTFIAQPSWDILLFDGLQVFKIARIGPLKNEKSPAVAPAGLAEVMGGG